MPASTSDPNRAVLHVCPTPIGNLGDISPRCVATLRSVDVVVAEDTRRSRQLLTALGLSKPLISLHRHNERQRIPDLLGRLERGQSLALVSDAGMPGISDPGERLIRAAIDAGFAVSALPGPMAAVLALVLSGLPAGRFAFEGFLPSRPAQRRAMLESLRDERRTLIFYEAPHRVVAMLKDIREVFGDRQVAVCRELTKLYEEVTRGALDEIIGGLDSAEMRGEFTIVVAGAPAEDIAVSVDSLRTEALGLMDQGHSRREAAAMVARRYRASRREVYALTLDAKDEDDGDGDNGGE